MMEATWWTQPDQLDEDQKKVVALPMEGNHLVVGPPGSAKTNLLSLRATYLHRAQVYDTVVLTFERVLREFLATGTGNYPFDLQKIQTYVGWGIGVLWQHGVHFDEHGNFEDVRRRLIEELSKVADSEDVSVRHECILIDEAQDYTENEVGVIRRFANNVFAVGD